MAQFKQWFEQDFTKPIEVRHCESVMFTGDDKGAVVGVLLYDNNVAYSGGGTVTGAVKRSDGGLVGLTGAISGNAASVVIPSAALAYPGPIGVHIILTQGGSVTTVLKAIYSVDDNSGAAVDPGTIIPSINDLITAINTAVASIPSDYSALSQTVAEMLEGESFSYSGVTVAHYGIYSNGLWTYNNNQDSYTLAISPNVKKIKATGNANGSIIAFLDTYSPSTGSTADFAEDYDGRITLTANESKEFAVTGDMHYFFALLKDSGGTSKTPTVTLYYSETDTTLSEAHISADAKAAGDLISQEAMRLSDNIWSVQSNGELYELPITGNLPFARYKVVSGDTVESDEGDLGTDYILAPKYLVITFDVAATSARVMLYFFTKSGSTYTPRWDLLSLTTSDGIKNYLSIANSVNRVIEVPDGTYIRMSNPVKGDVKVFGWSGKHFGCEISGSRQSPTDGNTYVAEAVQASGKTGIIIPGSARMICAKSAIFRNVWGRSGNTYTKIIESGRLQALRLPKGYDAFYIRVLLDASVPYNSSAPDYTSYAYMGDLAQNISALCAYQSSKPYGKARDVIARAKQLLSIPWTCLRPDVTVVGSTTDERYMEGGKFRGIPYMSRWVKPCFLGWHISAHTFVNAANDKRSVFYLESGRTGGPGYGLVCSSFASLAAGFPYPLTNYDFLKDPKCSVQRTNQAQSGMVHTNGNNHCLIPELNGYGADFAQYTLYEAVVPLSERTDNLDCAVFPDGRINNYSYINDYVYVVDHNDSKNKFNEVYDVTDVTIVNGTARPYRGDRCVYTSNDEILINIKDTSATVCYYQKCTYDAATKEFTLTGSAQSVAVRTDDSYYAIIANENISDGFWAVWTNVDTVKEYFEYHTAPEVTYTYTPSTNFTFNVSDDSAFWYALWWQDDTPSEETEIVPYDQNGDYSEYAKVYNPNGADGYVFFKGTLGAYVVVANAAQVNND